MIISNPLPGLRVTPVVCFALGAVAGFALARALHQLGDAAPGFDLLDPGTWPDGRAEPFAEVPANTAD